MEARSSTSWQAISSGEGMAGRWQGRGGQRASVANRVCGDYTGRHVEEGVFSSTLGTTRKRGGGGGGMHSVCAWPWWYDRRPSHLYYARTEHVGFSPTRRGGGEGGAHRWHGDGAWMRLGISEYNVKRTCWNRRDQGQQLEYCTSFSTALPI